jgi:ketosteroid isomerase-like protein
MKTKYVAGLTLVGILAGTTAGWAQSAGTGEKELIALENTWKQAVVKRDAAALRLLYADEYMSTDQEGMVWNKARDIAIDTTGVSRLTAYKLDDVKVRFLGDVAVVTGRNTSKGTLDGRPSSGVFRFTDVFVRRDGRWQCVATQTTAVVKP